MDEGSTKEVNANNVQSLGAINNSMSQIPEDLSANSQSISSNISNSLNLSDSLSSGTQNEQYVGDSDIVQPSGPQTFKLPSTMASQDIPTPTPTISESFVSAPTVNTMNMQSQTNQGFQQKIRKILIISAITFLSLGILGAGGYFGFYYYQRSSDLSILNKAEKNLLEIKGAQVSFEMGTENVSVGGKLLIDGEQDAKLDLGDYLGSMDFMYLKNNDAFYVSSDSYSLENTDASEKEFIEYKNVSAAAEKYGITKVFRDNVNITKDDLKYVVRQEDEKIDGLNLYKYKLNIDDETKNNIIQGLKDKSKEVTDEDLGYEISLPDFTLTFWIDKSNLKMYKLEFNATVKITYDEDNFILGYTAENTEGDGKTVTMDYDIHFGLKFSYENQENVSLPENAKISETVDLTTIKEESKAKLNDAKNKALVHEVQNSLEQYYVDNNVYPSSLEVLKTADPVLLNSDLDTTVLTYSVDSSKINYTLSFPLEYQSDSGDNVIGESPNKRYQVVNKQ